MSGIQQFLSLVNKNRGFARPNRFQVVIPKPDIAELFTYDDMLHMSFLCEVSELPGRSLITGDRKIYGPITKMPYQTQYSDITMTFLCTNTFRERNMFETWIDYIMPVKGEKDSTRNIRYKDTYTSQIRIVQFRDDQDIESENDIYAVVLREAFPISIAPQPLNYADDGFHRLSVEFAYSHYNTEYFPYVGITSPLKIIGQ